MKVDATTPEEFFQNCGKYEGLAREIDSLLHDLDFAQDRRIHTSDSITLLGYGFTPYKNSCYDGLWPTISMAPQKSSLNFYAMLYEEGKPVVEQYKEIFGTSNVGVGCIRIRKLTPQRKAALEKIIHTAQRHTSL